MCRKCLDWVDYLGIAGNLVCCAIALLVTHGSLRMSLGPNVYETVWYWLAMSIVVALLMLIMVPWYFIKRFFVGHTMDEETRAKYHRMM